MKYYDLVFEVGIEKLYFSWVLHTVGPFEGVPEGTICCTWLQFVTSRVAFYWLSFCLLTLMTSLWLYSSHWYHNTVTLGVQLPSTQPHTL